MYEEELTLVREKTRSSRRKTGSIWDTRKLRAMRKEPVGVPVDLTKEDALAVAKEAFGKRPDLPSGEEYIRRLKPIWRGLLKNRDG